MNKQSGQVSAARELTGPLPVGCADCMFLPECGGLGNQGSLWGCFAGCETTCSTETCPWTCPHKPIEFMQRWREVGGLTPQTVLPLCSLASEEQLPQYIPAIHHGNMRSVPLAQSVAAVPTYRLVRRQRGGWFGPSVQTANELQAAFGLAPGTRVLLVSPAFDDWLELFWRYRRDRHFPQLLAGLGLVGVTVPNFSFFDDAPRTHTLWNRRRIVRVAERPVERRRAGYPAP